MPPNDLPQRLASAGLSRRDRQDVIHRIQSLNAPARSFVLEIARQAEKGRGRLDEDAFGIIRATLEALQQSGGAPPPILFGVTHYQTGRVEHVRFLPPGVQRLPNRGRFFTNHPGLRSPNHLPRGNDLPPHLRGRLE